MRGKLSPFPVCWFLGLLESPCLGVLYLVVDRVTGFACNGSSISNEDIDLRLCFCGALDLCFDSCTAFNGSTCLLGERELNRDYALS